MHQVHAAHLVSEEVNEEDAGESRNQYCAAKTFPGFSGTDAGNHFVAANQRADRIGPGVAEFGDENEVKEVIMAIDSGEEIDFLDEIQEPGHIHEAEQGGGNSQNTCGVAPRKELAEAQAEDKQNEENGLKIIHPRGSAMNSEMAGEMQKRADHEQDAPQDAPAREADQIALFDQAIELGEANGGQKEHD